MTGLLHVTVDNPSQYLSSNLPYVVRDARHAVVVRATAGDTVELPTGYYTVSAIDPDGDERTQLVEVRDGETQPVAFTTTGDDVPPPVPAPAPPPPAVEEPDADEPGAATFPGSFHDSYAAAPQPGEELSLLATDGCSAHEIAYASWSFEPDRNPEQVPTARFQLGERTFSMSLPLNPSPEPGSDPGLTGCTVSLITDPGLPPRVRMAFAPGRRVARTVDGLIESGHLLTAQDLLLQASRLLLDKYSDPAAAALGGLTLQRLGRLDPAAASMSWVENLARDFPWIPDGSLLLADLLRARDEHERGLQILLHSTARRPMFTDGLSLAMTLLRRWPTDDARPLRQQRLEQLSAYSVCADWSAVNLTTFDDRG